MLKRTEQSKKGRCPLLITPPLYSSFPVIASNEPNASIQDAPQSLPRKNRHRLQRHEIRRWCHNIQKSGQSIYREAGQCSHRARFPLSITGGIHQPSQGKCREEAEGEGGRGAYVSEEAALGTEGSEDG